MQALKGITPPELEELLYLSLSDSTAQGFGESFITQVFYDSKEAARQLSAETTGQLVMHAIAMGDIELVAALRFGLPAAYFGLPAAVSSFLRAAADSGLLAREPLKVLMLSSPSKVDVATVCYMLKVILKSKSDKALDKITCWVSAAKRIDAVAMQQLLGAAIAADNPYAVRQLCKLPGSQELGREALAQLLERAVQAWGEELSNMVGGQEPGLYVRGLSTRALSSLAAQVGHSRRPEVYDRRPGMDESDDDEADSDSSSSDSDSDDDEADSDDDGADSDSDDDEADSDSDGAN